MRATFDSYVTEALFDDDQAAFALSDGTIAWEGGARVEAHDGVILCAVRHPLGGLITGGDDGRVVHSTPDGVRELACLRNRWIDALAVSAPSGLLAFAAGREAHVRDLKDPAFSRVFTHDRSVAAVAFDPKGRRLAAATSGGGWPAR